MLVLSEYETVGRAAERLGVKRQRVHQLIKSGKLEAVQHGPRAWLVKIASVDRRLDEYPPRAAAAPEVE